MTALHLEKESALEAMPTEYAGIMTLTHAWNGRPQIALQETHAIHQQGNAIHLFAQSYGNVMNGAPA